MADTKKILIYDTTLRDGSQGEGINYSLTDKIRIAEKLDELGVQYIEGGWPSNPKDALFFKTLARRRFRCSKITAFGSTRRAGIAAAADLNLKQIVASEVRTAALFGKSWQLHVRNVLRTTPEENLAMISDSIRFLIKKGLTVLYDAEHFFAGYMDDPKYALRCLKAAEDAGASYLVLCDTNGGMLPSQVARVAGEVRAHVKAPLGVHCHNDSATAVANSLAGVEAGCNMVQGTINGYGERCGNADLIPIIANLSLKMGYSTIPRECLKKLTEVSHFVAEVSNMRHLNSQPYAGESAFAHKAGVHINAMIKDPLSYEHLDPEAVGNRRRILVSELGGKSSILILAKEFNLDLTKDDPKTQKIHKLLQDLEMKGYHFEAAEASFELLLKKALKKVKESFKLESFRVVVNKDCDGKVTTEAIIKLRVGGKLEHTAAEGDGPVNALDNCLRKALKDFYPKLARMHLSDFKVRVLEEKAGTAAKVRVLIQSQDETDSWNTIGVSENIIEASWQALTDSVEYKLMKDQSL
jgi:2-isopropylmalate synthase